MPRIENIPKELLPFVRPITCASKTCGKSFTPNNVNQKYCSQICKRRESKRQNAKNQRTARRERVSLTLNATLNYAKETNVNKPGIIPRYLAEEMLQIVGIHLPQVGERYWWEPVKQYARELCTVTSVKWNGEEFWVASQSNGGPEVWNEWSRWIEATVLYDTPDDPEPNPSDTLQTFSITVKDSPVVLRIVSE